MAALDANHLVIVLSVLQEAQGELLLVAQTARLARLLARLGEDREEDRRQDGDDRDDDEQLNECETLASHETSPAFPRMVTNAEKPHRDYSRASVL